MFKGRCSLWGGASVYMGIQAMQINVRASMCPLRFKCTTVYRSAQWQVMWTLRCPHADENGQPMTSCLARSESLAICSTDGQRIPIARHALKKEWPPHDDSLRGRGIEMGSIPIILSDCLPCCTCSHHGARVVWLLETECTSSADVLHQLLWRNVMGKPALVMMSLNPSSQLRMGFALSDGQHFRFCVPFKYRCVQALHCMVLHHGEQYRHTATGVATYRPAVCEW